MSTIDVNELHKKMQEFDKEREVYVLRARENELSKLLVQLEIDRINVSKDLTDIAEKIKRRGV